MATQTTINKVNGIDLNTLKNTIDNIKKDPELAKCKFHINNKWINANHNRSLIRSFYGAKQEMQHKQTFEIDADEPPILAGNDMAPNPVEHLLNALASCVTTSLVAHAAVRGIKLEEVESEIEGDIDLQGFLGLSENTPKGYTDIRVKFKIKTDEKDTDKLKTLAQFSPVYNTIINGAKVDIQIERK